MASRSTRDHEEILRWAAQRGACPAVVSRTGGRLRMDFDPERAASLAPVDWDGFFRVFEDKGLELIYDDKPGSRFHKFIYPETAAAKAPHRPVAKPAPASQRMHIVPPPARATGASGAKPSQPHAAKRRAASPGSSKPAARRSRPPKAAAKSPARRRPTKAA